MKYNPILVSHGLSLLAAMAALVGAAGPLKAQEKKPPAVAAEQDLRLAGSPRLTLDARAGYYLRAVDVAENTLRTSGADPRSLEIYNEACAQLTSMLRSADGQRLWNRTETISSGDGIYRLHFAAGSRKEGTWNPGYFDSLLTPSQVHEKIAHHEARTSDWGGVLVGVYKPSDPRKYFLLDSTLQSLKKDWSLLATRSSCLPGT